MLVTEDHPSNGTFAFSTPNEPAHGSFNTAQGGVDHRAAEAHCHVLSVSKVFFIRTRGNSGLVKTNVDMKMSEKNYCVEAPGSKLQCRRLV